MKKTSKMSTVRSIAYSQATCAFVVSTSVIHVKPCLVLVINYANLSWIRNWYDCFVIGCTCHELLDKECTFPCTRAVSKAMKQNCTWRLRTDYTIIKQTTSTLTLFETGFFHVICTREADSVTLKIFPLDIYNRDEILYAVKYIFQTLDFKRS